MFAETKTDLLDVRKSPASAIHRAVNIPLSELPQAANELPPRSQPIRIALTGEEAELAVRTLTQMERQAVLEPRFKYQPNESPLRLWNPNEFLLDVLPVLDPGKAIDLACGGGRESATMAYFGWHVTGIDLLPDAVQRAEVLAARFDVNSKTTWQAIDLIGWSPTKPFDLATMFLYLDRDLIRRVVESLSPGGSLLLETFTPTHRESLGKPSRQHLVISKEEMTELASELEVVHCSEDWRASGRHTCRFWGRKRI